MLKKSLFYLLIFTLVTTACKNNSNQQEQSEGMEQFSEDEDFKKAHDSPEEIALDARGEMITFDTPDGTTGSAYALKTASPSNKYLFVIQEWWGLNDHIKKESDRLFAALGDVNVLALDMYDGKVADNPDDAGKLMQAVKQERAEAIVKGAIAHAGYDAEIGTIGWCFGGGWSLRASIMAGDQAAGCVMYYGMPVQKANELAPLKTDILGIFAEKDGWITPKVANDFKALADATGKNLTIHQFDAEHAFANPSNPNYDAEAAAKANKLVLEFLQERL